MRTRELTRYERRLLRERDRLTAERAELEASGDSNHVAIAVHDSVELADVENVLRLLHQRPALYGRCVVCGKDISSKRLDLIPTARVCDHHASVTV